MADLIDRDKLRLFPIRRDHYDKENGNEHFVFGIESVLEYVEQLPAVDAVPVVRCKNCKHRYGAPGQPNIDCYNMHEDDFCSYGERIPAYIEREALLKALGEEPKNWTESDRELQEVQDWREFRSMIKSVPAADVEPVRHGRWIERAKVKGQVYCSECATLEKSTDSNYKSRYCPHCGAKMDLEADHGEA